MKITLNFSPELEDPTQLGLWCRVFGVSHLPQVCLSVGCGDMMIHMPVEIPQCFRRQLDSVPSHLAGSFTLWESMRSASIVWIVRVTWVIVWSESWPHATIMCVVGVTWLMVWTAVKPPGEALTAHVTARCDVNHSKGVNGPLEWEASSLLDHSTKSSCL